MQHLFLIGPGGAGKTTCGRLLAQRLSVPFIDLDSEFMTQIGNIDACIHDFGYECYFRKNSLLFSQILPNLIERSVFALSSGFLTYPDVIVLAENRRLIEQHGKSICLMPSGSYMECVSIILNRQLNRGQNRNAANQKAIIEKRFWIYRTLGDHQVFSKEAPDKIVNTMYDITETFFHSATHV